MNALKAKGLTLLYTAPYSPMCNPIETFFHELKTEFHRNPRIVSTATELKSKIQEALAPFSKRDLSNHFRSVYNLKDKILAREDF